MIYLDTSILVAYDCPEALSVEQGVPFATADRALARSGANLGLRVIPVGGRRRSRPDAP